MKDKKHIDRLFQEKFKNFEATPDDANWGKINDRLHKKKRKRRVIPIWWQLGGVAAVLLLLLTIGNFIKDNTNNNSKETIVNVNTEDSSINSNTNKNGITDSKKESSTKIVSSTEDKINSGENSLDNVISIKKNDDSNNSTLNLNNNKSKVTNTYNTKKPIINKTSNSLKKDINSVISKTQNDVTDNLLNSKESNKKLIKDKLELNSIIKNTKSDISTKVSGVTTESNSKTKNEKEDDENANEETTDTTKKENTIEEAIAEIEDITEKEEEKLSRWSVSSNVAPVYFNTLGEGSSINSQFNNNSKSGNINMSFGIAGSYTVNKKLKIRAGVNKVALGYNTNDVIVFDGVSRLADPNNSSLSSVNNDSEIQNITFKESNTIFISSSNISFNNAPEALRTLPKSSLDQQFGFIEIPIEAEYTLINKKLGINLIGGFSTFFLSENEIYTTTQGNRILIGEANNINTISYSANIGLGVSYNVSKKINLNLEPMFKYQINTFNDTSGNFQPYFIGIYTGLSFKF